MLVQQVNLARPTANDTKQDNTEHKSAKKLQGAQLLDCTVITLSTILRILKISSQYERILVD